MRAQAAGNAFAAGFVAIELDGGEGHVKHARGVVANDDGAGAEHGSHIGESLEIEAHVGHSGGKVAGRRAGGSKSLELTASGKATGNAEDHIANGDAQRHFEDAGIDDVAGDANEFEATRTVGGNGFVPVNAAREDLRHIGESLDVVDDGGLLEKAGLAGEGRLVAGLGAMAFDGFQERGFLAADVTAGTDKDVQIEIEVTAEEFLAEKACLDAAGNLLAEDFLLKGVFVADIEDAFFRTGDQAGDDHAFGDEVRKVIEDEAILDGARLAFVGIADDVFCGVGLLADEVPLHPGGETGATHATKFSLFQGVEDGIEITISDEFAKRAVLFSFGVRIGSAGHAHSLGMRGMQLFAASGATGEPLDVIRREGVEDGVVYRDGGRPIAAAETADILDLNLFRACMGEAAREFGAKLAGTVQAAAHVGADMNFGVRRRREMKMGIKTGEAMNLVEGGLRAPGKGFEFGLGKIAETRLDDSQFIEDHRSVGSRARTGRQATGASWV